MQPMILKFTPSFPGQIKEQAYSEQKNDRQRIVSYAIVFLFGLFIGLLAGLLTKGHQSSSKPVWKDLHTSAYISK